MSATSEILSELPIDQLAEQVGASPEETEAAVRSVVPALLGGMEANIQHPGGQSALLEALDGHVDSSPTLDEVNTDDGAKIAQHVFGDQQDAVVNQLGGLPGTSNDLVRRLIPIIAPIVISYLAKRVLGGGAGTNASASAGSSADILTQILSGVLGGSVPGAQSAGQGSQHAQPQQQAGPNWGDILGNVLGGGTRI